MGLQDEKSEVFAQVAALKVLAEDAKRTGGALWSALQEISQDPIGFLIDLIKELVGYEALRDGVSNFLATNLNTVEDNVKYIIKLKLKELISCGVNPQIPPDLRNDGAGYNLKVNNLDYTNIFKLDPESKFGGFIYTDISSQINSSDANTFLYHTIQDDGNENMWGNQAGFNDILSVTFNSSTSTNTNILNVKASEYYSDNKKLVDFNGDYIDSINLFPDAQFFGKMLDTVFNVFTGAIQKTQTQTETEEIVSAIVDKLLDSDPDDFIDDSYFSFNNTEMVEITEKARLRALGITKLNGCYSYPQPVNPNTVLRSIDSIQGATLNEEKKKVIDDSISKFSDVAAGLGDTKDKYNIKLNFFTELIRALVKSIVGMIFTPKMLMIFLINYKIIQGADVESIAIEELMKLLKQLVKEVIDIVKGMIISYLLEIALKEIKALQSDVVYKIQQELVANRLKSLLSLTGVPQDVIRTIAKF